MMDSFRSLEFQFLRFAVIVTVAAFLLVNASMSA